MLLCGTHLVIWRKKPKASDLEPLWTSVASAGSRASWYTWALPGELFGSVKDSRGFWEHGGPARAQKPHGLQTQGFRIPSERPGPAGRMLGRSRLGRPGGGALHSSHSSWGAGHTGADNALSPRPSAGHPSRDSKLLPLRDFCSLELSENRPQGPLSGDSGALSGTARAPGTTGNKASGSLSPAVTKIQR